MPNKRTTGIIFFIFLLLLQIAIPINTFFKSANSQNVSNITTSNPLNNISSNLQDIKKVKVDDINIGYKIFGKGGPPLLLIMGFGGSMNNWDPIMIKKLSLNHTVIVFDNRGVGNTESGNKNFSISQFAKDTIGLINALHINKTDVMGFSMGGFIAQEIALNNPEKINKLVIYASNCGGRESTPPTPELSKLVQNTSKSMQEILDGVTELIFPKEWSIQNPQVIETVKEGYKIPPVISMDTIQKQGIASSYWYNTGVCNQLEKITTPTLIVVGTKDILTPKANSLIMTEKIPDAWLVQIKNGGHGVMYQYPNKFTSIVQAFLE
jgi:pimeloyl-ACP methyl ester carboxylesterase